MKTSNNSDLNIEDYMVMNPMNLPIIKKWKETYHSLSYVPEGQLDDFAKEIRASERKLFIAQLEELMPITRYSKDSDYAAGAKDAQKTLLNLIIKRLKDAK